MMVAVLCTMRCHEIDVTVWTPKESIWNERDANSIIIRFIHHECIGFGERHTHAHRVQLNCDHRTEPIEFLANTVCFWFFRFFVFAKCVFICYMHTICTMRHAIDLISISILNHIASAIRAETIMSDNLYFARTNLTTKIAWNCYYYSQGLCGALCVWEGRNEGYGARSSVLCWMCVHVCLTTLFIQCDFVNCVKSIWKGK